MASWVRRAGSSSACPAAVGTILPPARSSSRTRKVRSSSRNCWLAAGWVRLSRCAAAETLPVSTTVRKVRNCRIVGTAIREDYSDAQYQKIFLRPGRVKRDLEQTDHRTERGDESCNPERPVRRRPRPREPGRRHAGDRRDLRAPRPARHGLVRDRGTVARGNDPPPHRDPVPRPPLPDSRGRRRRARLRLRRPLSSPRCLPEHGRRFRLSAPGPGRPRHRQALAARRDRGLRTARPAPDGRGGRRQRQHRVGPAASGVRVSSCRRAGDSGLQARQMARHRPAPAVTRSRPHRRTAAVMDRRFLGLVLGINQTLSWGMTFYLPAIVADPVARSFGASHVAVLGAFSWALLITGACMPRVGRWIDRHGGRGSLLTSIVIMAAGQVLLAAAPGLPLWYVGWTVVGIGMAMGLYDAAFATVGSLLGREAGPTITGITLVAGFASTVFWTLGASLIGPFGWRGLLLFYAALMLAVNLPMVWLL